MRPFEIGDVVVIHLEGFLKENEIFIDVSKVDCFMKNGNIRCCLDDRESTMVYTISPHDTLCIKTIRSPRHGTAKERRMVAVLAREYHKIRLHNFYHAISCDLQNGTKKEKIKQKEFWESVRNGSRFCDLHTKKHYDKLKAMLKEG